MPANKQNFEYGPDLIKIMKSVSKLYTPLFGKELSLDDPEEKHMLDIFSGELIHKFCENLQNIEPGLFDKYSVDDMSALIVQTATKKQKTEIEKKLVNMAIEWIESIDPYQFKNNTLQKAQNIANDMSKHLLYQKNPNTSQGGFLGFLLIVVFIIIVIILIAQ